MTKTITFLDHMSMTNSTPEGMDRQDEFDGVTVTFTDGSERFVFYPKMMPALYFIATANWTKQRMGSPARVKSLEFDR